MAAVNPFDSRKVFCALSGASRGIGRTIAVKFAQQLPSGSLCILLARSIKDLEGTKELAAAANSEINIQCYSIDLCRPNEEELHGIFQGCLNGIKPSEFDQAIIVHNVGSVGDVSESASKMDNMGKWQEYFCLNVFTVAILNAEFLKIFSADIERRLIINITSLCGLQPFKSLGYYCCGKAAREMYFKVLAKEEEGKLTVLNYSPGPVETDMFTEIIQNVGDEETLESFLDMQERKVVLTCDQTIGRLVEILEKGSYASGDHIDYFDEN